MRKPPRVQPPDIVRQLAGNSPTPFFVIEHVLSTTCQFRKINGINGFLGDHNTRGLI